MKKQNNNNKLAFSKAAVTELDSTQLIQINGGTSIVGGDDRGCTGCCCGPILSKLEAVA
jgi:hypothetical protein